MFARALETELMEWSQGLCRSGLYYEGFVAQDQLDTLLELHKRTTGTTYGTRTSSRLGTKTSTCNVKGEQEKENSHQSAETTKVKSVSKLMHKTKLIMMNSLHVVY